MFDLLGTMKLLGGYYECGYDQEGKPLGPLVGYAGRYDAGGGTMKQYVGTAYFNFAVLEQSTEHLRQLAKEMAVRAPREVLIADCVLGMPMGGLAFSLAVAMALDCSFAFAEKQVMELATPDSREKSKLKLMRHVLKKGGNVVIGEDVVNNFSTTAEAVELVRSAGANVSAIICAINRSSATVWNDIPVISYAHRPTPQYCQEDPLVSGLVDKGKVVWKPKTAWDELMAAM